MYSSEHCLGSNYSKPVVQLTGGGSFTKPAKARAILIKNQIPNGLGADPRDDLRATSIMFNTKPSGTESGDWVVGQDFRQVGLLKNQKVDSDTELAFTCNRTRTKKIKKFASITQTFTLVIILSLVQPHKTKRFDR